jgi:lipoprotein-releasing system ATP-binding protein
MSTLVEARHLVKTYGEVSVLNDLSLKIERGDFLAITGPSGSGKSTLLHILGGLDHADSGDLFFEGEAYPSQSKAVDRFRNTHLGFVFQFHHLLPEFTALENICMPGWIGKHEDIEARALHWAEALGVAHRLNHLPSALSGGEQQRVAVARALVHGPKLLLADEPSGNLDRQRSSELFDILQDVRKHSDVAMVVVTHSEEWASKADRTLHLSDGAWRS